MYKHFFLYTRICILFKKMKVKIGFMYIHIQIYYVVLIFNKQKTKIKTIFDVWFCNSRTQNKNETKIV